MSDSLRDRELFKYFEDGLDLRTLEIVSIQGKLNKPDIVEVLITLNVKLQDRKGKYQK